MTHSNLDTHGISRQAADQHQLGSPTFVSHTRRRLTEVRRARYRPPGEAGVWSAVAVGKIVGDRAPLVRPQP